MRAVKCTLCQAQAIYKSPYSGQLFCARCFKRNVEGRVRATINHHKLFEPNDHILIAVSGGKDSLVLLNILYKLEARRPGVKLTALTIDEGVAGYRGHGLRVAEEAAKRLGVEHHVASFKEYYGYTLDEIYDMAVKKRVGLHACTFCGVLRRRLINVKARELGATKVATGHNLDDEAQTALINLLRGTVSRLARLGPKPPRMWEGFVPRVKPLRYIPEREVALYAYLSGFELYEEECRYVRASLRDEIRYMLNKLESKHPGMKYAVVRAVDRLAPLIEREVDVKVKPCRYCGEPTARDICRACEVLEQLGIKG
ncbi:MAG: TIGR00269 family protein [Thermoprotei archaeon]|nr:MAG: TIGR00269 family protein [Thermoprotei archaeon]